MGFLKDNVHLEIFTWNDRSGSLFLDFFALLFVKKSCNLFPSGISSQLEILRENTEVVLIFGLLRHSVVGSQFISNWYFLASWK